MPIVIRPAGGSGPVFVNPLLIESIKPSVVSGLGQVRVVMRSGNEFLERINGPSPAALANERAAEIAAEMANYLCGRFIWPEQEGPEPQ